MRGIGPRGDEHSGAEGVEPTSCATRKMGKAEYIHAAVLLLSSTSWHRLSPRDMSFEAKRFRHVGVALPEGGGRRAFAATPRQDAPAPQQPDLAYHQTLIGWRGRGPLDGGLGFGPVTGGPAIEQPLHPNPRRRN